MTVANINVLIDLQNGFARDGLTLQQGGSLYVPGGEKVGEVAARLIDNSAASFLILSQDYHPRDHISFASNHKGIEPLSTMNLSQNPDGIYKVAPENSAGSLRQTAWTVHCVEGTESALFVPEVMDALPHSMRVQLEAHGREAFLRAEDDRRNVIYAIRKGMRSDLDSYGIATENDGVSTTAAPEIFKSIAEQLQGRGVSEVNINIGGLATNFCAEFSHNDIYKFLVPRLNEAGIKANVYFITDISAGIPIETPDGSWPDLVCSQKRMVQFGTQETTTDDIIRGSLSGNTLNSKHLPTPEY